MQHPELVLRAHKVQKRNSDMWKFLFGIIVGFIITLLLTTVVRADELDKVEVGIAPNSEAVEAKVPYLDEYLPYNHEIQELFYKTWTGAGLEYVDCLVLLDMESDAKGNGVIEDTSQDISPTHDYGFFQINWPSWKRAAKKLYGVTSSSELMDPSVNVGMAVYVFSDCVQQAKTVESRFACYNTGKPYKSTKYSREAMKARDIWVQRLSALG